MKKEDIILPGENFEWHEESGTMLGNDYQQADAIIVMDNWISIFGGQFTEGTGHLYGYRPFCLLKFNVMSLTYKLNLRAFFLFYVELPDGEKNL